MDKVRAYVARTGFENKLRAQLSKNADIAAVTADNEADAFKLGEKLLDAYVNDFANFIDNENKFDLILSDGDIYDVDIWDTPDSNGNQERTIVGWEIEGYVSGVFPW